MDTDLHDYINTFGPLTEDKARFVIKRITLAIKRYHEKGIIHRDLKPENILLKLDSKNEIIDIRLADFGNSKENKKHLCQNRFSGTACFTSPEMLKFGNYFDHRVDIWCLGLVSHFIMVGFQPLDKFTSVNQVAYYLKNT